MQRIISDVGLFPPEMLQGMLERSQGTAELWLVAEMGEQVALLYCAPERMTDGTWNNLLLAVRPDMQRRGIGAALLRRVEAMLAPLEARLLLVETSDVERFEPVRAFYAAAGYAEVARIPEYYAEGDGKVIFSKVLGSGAPH